MRMKIKDFKPTDKANLILRLSDIQLRKTQSNADYASMLGFDGEELIEVKIWSLTDDKKDLLENGQIYELSGQMKDYQGKMQFNVSDIKVCEDEDLNRDEFYEFAKMDKKELEEEIVKYINKIDNQIIKTVVFSILKEHFDGFFIHPAAMSMHHNYIGGLSYHVYSMLKLSDAYLDLYPFLNKSLVYGGVILHDIGKMIELSGARGTEYTKVGKLLGHISIASNLINQTATKLGYQDTDEILSLQHIILSHHGHLEYGSPKEPMIAEAALIFMLDYSDSRLASLEKEIPSTEKGTFTNPISAFSRKAFYVPKI